MTAPFDSEKMLQIFTDGSAHERAGLPGGWAYVVLRNDEVLAQATGAERHTTGNLMELRAAVEGLRAAGALAHRDEAIELVSDSRITVDIAAGLTRPKKHAAQADALRELTVATNASARWVRAHAGLRWNEVVDAMAHQAKQRLVPARVKARCARRSTSVDGIP